MRTIHLSYIILVLMISTAVVSCHKGNGSGNQTDSPPNLSQPAPVHASVQGKVVDENNSPVAGATVKAGNSTTTTDSKGIFIFSNIQLDRYASVVTVEFGGYFKAFRTFSIKSGVVDFIKFKLIRKLIGQTVFSQSGGTVTLPGNSAVTIAPGSIVFKSNNQPFAGLVEVNASFIDPTAADIAETVPGSFMAIDSMNNSTVLKSFGLMTVELRSQGIGDPLQIAPNKTARLKIGIPASLQSSAPASIPFWMLDETTGLWRQQGRANKINNAYETDVSHFSSWNCDLSFVPIFLEATFKDAQGIPLSHARILFRSLTSGMNESDYTDINGYVSGFVPTYEPIRITVLNTCNEAIYTQDLGQLTQNKDLGTITVTLPVQYTMQVTGKLVNCNDQPVTHGSALIYFENELYVSPVTSNGNFSATLIKCPNTSAIQVIAFDSTANQQSSFYGFVPVAVLNTGTLTACGTSAISYIHYKYDNSPFDLSSANGDTLVASANLNPNGTGFPLIHVVSRTQPAAVSMHLEYSGPWGTPGTYGITNFSCNQLGPSSASTPFQVTITTFGAVGQFVEGTINAKLLELGTTFHTITGNFRIKRIE